MHNKKKIDSGKIWLTSEKFQRGRTNIFNVNVQSMLSPLSSLEIGHDNSGLGPGWYLDQVIVYCPNTGMEQVFTCKKWLSRDEGDGLIQRTLYENTALRKKGDKSRFFFVWLKHICSISLDLVYPTC